MSYPVYKMKLKDGDKVVYAISLVKYPAYGTKAVAFAEMSEDIKEAEKIAQLKFKLLNAENRLITGPVMRPDYNIYRIDKETDREFYVYASAEDIVLAAQKFFSSPYRNNVNFEHKSHIPVPGMVMVESWIVADEKMDKAYFLHKTIGAEYPCVGDWWVTYKVTDDIVWEEFVKTGIFNYSLEGIFTFEDEDEEYRKMLEKAEEYFGIDKKDYDEAAKFFNVVENRVKFKKHYLMFKNYKNLDAQGRALFSKNFINIKNN